MSLQVESATQLNSDAIRLKLLEGLSSIHVPEFDMNAVELDLLQDVRLVDNKLIVSIALPTFALKSERAVAYAIKSLAVSLAPKDTEVELNVYANVQPAAKQSLLKPGVCDVRNVVLVASGKGGVGKSTVASNLAVALARLGCSVGLLDADVYGPSVPTMFGTPHDTAIRGVGGDTPETALMVPVERHGVKLMSIGFLVDTASAMIWRGPMIANASMQLFYQVAWGDLDYLIVDLPPGTGDIQLTIAQRVNVAGCVVVSTPQDVALADVVRAKSMLDKVGIPALGIVENMSYFVCDGCDKRHDIFTHGGARAAGERLGFPFLGEIPIETSVRAGGDAGTPVVAVTETSVASKAFTELAHHVATSLAKMALTAGGGSRGPEVYISGTVSGPKARRGLPVVV